MGEVVTFNEKALNAFENAAATLSGGNQFPILKFIKGGWYVGQDNEKIPLGAEVVADMDSAEWGWVRWKDQKPVDRRMVVIATGAQLPDRETLGSLDQDMWERDDRGVPRDPWQKMIEIPVKEIDGRQMILAGGSRGHDGACRAFFSEYIKGKRQQGDKLPIIKLQADSYNHAKYGITHVPVMALAGWFDPNEPVKAKAPVKRGKF